MGQGKIDTLRVSVTDRCNLRCVYCMPPEGIPLIPAARILRYEEILRVVQTGVAHGIRKVRITGGEPLARKDLDRFVASLAALDELADICLTTNGVLLKNAARSLREAGLQRVTVSLDTLRPDRYREITGRDVLGEVLDGIEAALSAGLHPVKINVVVIRDLNDDEVVDVARMTIARPIEVRFIERMPIGKREETRGCGLWQREGLPGDEVRRRIEKGLGSLEEASPVVPYPGPARLYRLQDSEGRIGFIMPMTHPFCHTCTRMRLTPDGKLRTCLFGSDETDMVAALRSPGSGSDLEELFQEAVERKRRRAQTRPGEMGSPRWMAQIGG